MNSETAITDRYPDRRIALVGDFCLDRYLEIDPALEEVSIETGLPVHNVTRVRSQPGGAGTILNNLVALGIGEIHPVTFAGRDGEGFELKRALRGIPGVQLHHFLQTTSRHTFTYTKPLRLQAGHPPVELSRLDIKNWSPTPAALQNRILRALRELAPRVDAIILLDQVDRPETGVITRRLLQEIESLARQFPRLLIIADSRQTLRDYPPVCLKMNRAELIALAHIADNPGLDGIRTAVSNLARHRNQTVFVTLAEEGMMGASPSGQVEHVPTHPLRGEIDIVGAGDAVTANLAAALSAGATIGQAMALANAAASIVIHQLGTTGTATRRQILSMLSQSRPPSAA